MLKQLRIFQEDELPYAPWPPDFNFRYWERIGEELKSASKKLTDQLMWDIGDWLLEGEVRGKLQERELRKHAERITGRAWPTIKNYKMYSKKFPASRRREALTYSLHVLVAKFDEAKQENQLDMASAWQLQHKKPLAVRPFEKEIERLQRTGMIPQNKDTGSSNGKEPEPHEWIKLRLPQKDYDFVRRLAFAVYGTHTPDTLIWEIVRKYWTKHKDEIKSKLEAFETRAKNPSGPRPEPIVLPD